MILDKEKIGNFLKFLQFDLLPVEGQRGIGEGKNQFVEDWLIIELAKSLYIGPERYLEDPIPRRLKNNENFNQEKILELANKKLKVFAKIESLNLEKYESLLISQVGRGLDILLGSMLSKSWKAFLCYDEDNRYEALLSIYFKEPIQFYHGIIPKEIKETDIVIENRRV